MMPTFASPLFFWGFISLAGLGLIYMLRMRSRRKVVSSLLLWVDQHTADTGGRIWRRMRTPLLFFVELLALILLILAAADPLWPRNGQMSVVVVLDNSYSMQASLEQSTDATTRLTLQDAARERLAEMFHEEDLRARVILAGTEPTLLRDSFTSAQSLSQLTSHWNCWEPTADLAAALTLARQVGGANVRLLVITDHPPLGPATESSPSSPEDETSAAEAKPVTSRPPLDVGNDVIWLAFGRSTPNLALVGAVRRDSRDGGLAVIEVANLAKQRQTGELTVKHGTKHSIKPLNIAPSDVSRFTIPLENTNEPLEVTLPPDALDTDNRLILLPERPPQLRVSVVVRDPKLRTAILRVLKADGNCQVTDVAPQLRFCDTTEKPRAECWDVYFAKGSQAKPVLGPFVLDRTHSLLEGVSFRDVVLVESAELDLPGQPLVMSDTGVLCSVDRRGSRSRRVTLQFDQEKTTLLDSIDFPVFVWNILQWRQAALPEYCRPNVTIGTTTALRLAPNRSKVTLKTPSKGTNALHPRDGVVIFSTDCPGPYTVRLDADRQLPLWAHVTFRDESDLRGNAEGTWGKWKITEESRLDFHSVAPLLLFLAIATWIAHGLLLRKEAKSR